MKSLMRLLGVVCVMVMASAVGAQEHALFPVPEHPYAYDVHAAPAIPMFHNVKYKDLHEMAPCAQPKIIIVKNPCADPCNICQPDCVAIQICVPTSGCELVSCRRNGDRIRYDYGKYKVDVRIKRNHIEVDYQN